MYHLVVSLAFALLGPIPVPDDAELQTSNKLVRTLFAADIAALRSPADKRALATRVLDEALATPNDHVGRYSLLLLAKSLAVEAGDARLAMSTTEHFQTYNINGPELERQTLVELSDTCISPEQAGELTKAAEKASLAAMANDNYAIAFKMVTTATAAARRSRDAGLLKSALATSKLVNECRSEYSIIDQAIIDKFNSGTIDGEVATMLGMFRCLTKGDWHNGLPLLAKSTDRQLRLAAEHDLKSAGTKSPAEMQARGTEWLALATKVDRKYKRQILLRAIHWFQSALPLLIGLDKIKSAKQLEELAAEVERVAVLPVAGEFRIATGKLRPGSSIASDDAGNFIIAYVAGDNIPALFVQIFDANCRPASKAIKVNVASVPIPPDPPKILADRVTGQVIAVGRHGQFAVVWDGWTSAGSREQRIFCRMFNKAGKPLCPEFRVNTAEIRQTSPAAVFSPTSNRLMVTWSQGADEDADVVARLFRASGAADGLPFSVTTTRDKGQHNPAVACDKHGHYSIAWWGTTAHDSEGISFRRFNGNGHALGPEIAVNDTRNFRQWLPVVATMGNGALAIVWSTTEVFDGERPGRVAMPAADAVTARIFNQHGQPVTTELRIGAGKQAQPSWLYTAGVTVSADDELIVAFNAVDDRGRNGIFLNRFSPAGVRIGGDVPVTAVETITDYAPAVTISYQAVITVWERASATIEIYGRRLIFKGGSSN